MVRNPLEFYSFIDTSLNNFIIEGIVNNNIDKMTQNKNLHYTGMNCIDSVPKSSTDIRSCNR